VPLLRTEKKTASAASERNRVIETYHAERDREGFGWPEGARIAVLLCSEYEPVYAVRHLKGGFTDHRHQAELRYEATSGLWRILKILDRYAVRSTFFVNGASAEKYPDSVEAIASRGHEIAAHSWIAEDHFSMTRDEEDEVIGRVVRVLEVVAGARPTGWLSPRAQISDNTIELLAKHGFLWHSDCYDDDMPYVLRVGGYPLVEVPRAVLTDDFALIGGHAAIQFGNHRNILQMWKDEFDVLYRESESEPRFYSISWHQCRLGRPALSQILDELLAYISGHAGVWFARGDEIARCFLKDRHVA
jgi:allantoinase